MRIKPSASTLTTFLTSLIFLTTTALAILQSRYTGIDWSNAEVAIPGMGGFFDMSDSLLLVAQPLIEDPRTVACGGTVRLANGCTIRQGLLVQAEWGQRLLDGAYQIRAYGINQLDQSKFAGQPGDRRLRGVLRDRRGLLRPVRAIADDAGMDRVHPDRLQLLDERPRQPDDAAVDGRHPHGRGAWRPDVISHFETRADEDAVDAPGFDEHQVWRRPLDDGNLGQQILGELFGGREDEGHIRVAGLAQRSRHADGDGVHVRQHEIRHGLARLARRTRHVRRQHHPRVRAQGLRHARLVLEDIQRGARDAPRVERSDKGRYAGGIKSVALYQYNSKGEMVYISNVSSGMTEEMKRDMARADIWPQVWACEYKDRRYVSKGDDTNALDFASFVRVHEDKKPEECINKEL